MTVVPRRTQWQPRACANGLLGPQLQPAGILRPSQPLGLHPVIHVPIITRITTHLPTPEGWMAELAMLQWLTDSGRLNRKVVTHPASSLAQDRGSSPAETSVVTTMLRRQPTMKQKSRLTINFNLIYYS